MTPKFIVLITLVYTIPLNNITHQLKMVKEKTIHIQVLESGISSLCIFNWSCEVIGLISFPHSTMVNYNQ